MADELVADVEQSLKRVQEFDAQTLARRDELGLGFALDEVVAPSLKVIDLFRQIPNSHIALLPEQNLTELRDRANSFYNTLTTILKFDPATDPSPGSTRAGYIDQVKATYGQAFSFLHPLIGFLTSRQRDFAAIERDARASVQTALDEIERIRSSLASSKDESEKILSEIRQVAAEQGVSQQAIYFRDEAASHETKANDWQFYTIWVAVGLGLISVAGIFLHKIPFIAPTNIYESIQLSISKILIFGVVAFMLVLCSKILMSHKHNYVVNKHRQNALLTFNSLVEAARGDDRKDIILTHAAACIFSPQETGYVKQAGPGDGNTPKLIEIAPKIGGSGAGTPG